MKSHYLPVISMKMKGKEAVMTSEGLQLKLKTIQSEFYYNQEKHPLYISLLSNIQSWQESDTFRKKQDLLRIACHNLQHKKSVGFVW